MKERVTEEELEPSVPEISPLERRIWEIIKKHQNRHTLASKEMVINELKNWCRFKDAPLVLKEEYGQAIYNLTHGYTVELHCTEIVHQEGGKEIIEYFSWED